MVQLLLIGRLHGSLLEFDGEDPLVGRSQITSIFIRLQYLLFDEAFDNLVDTLPRETNDLAQGTAAGVTPTGHGATIARKPVNNISNDVFDYTQVELSTDGVPNHRVSFVLRLKAA